MTGDSAETMGSLCSGVGGLDRATLLRPVWHAEIEPGPALLLQKHWPDAVNLGDFRVTDWSAVEPVTEMVMGVPCQPFSAAGRQRAEADARYLWPSAYAGIVALRPQRVFFENVRNLVSIKNGEIWRGILADLRGAGYACRWLILGACAVGAPHHRHRVFLLARYVGHGAPPAERLDVQPCGSSHPVLASSVARDATTRGEMDGRYLRGERALNGAPLGMVVQLLPTPRSADAIRGPARADRNVDLGRGNGLDLAQALNLLPTPRAGDHQNGASYRNARHEPGGLAAVGRIDFGKYAEAVARWEAVTGLAAPEPTELGPRGGRRLAAPFAEWMMGFVSGYLTDVDYSMPYVMSPMAAASHRRRVALKAAGNGVVSLQAYRARQLLLDSLRRM